MIDLKLLREQPDEVIAHLPRPPLRRRRRADGAQAHRARHAPPPDRRHQRRAQAEAQHSGRPPSAARKIPTSASSSSPTWKAIKGQIAQADQAIARPRRGDADARAAATEPARPVGADRQERRGEQGGARDRRQARSSRSRPSRTGISATELGIIDFERGVKISGTRFYLLRGVGARLQRALITWMLDVHIEQGYTEVYPPQMVKGECLVGTAQLPKFGENLYRDAEEDFYWVPTAEVPVTNMYRDEVLDADALPIKHVAYTACFRREKMAHGKDTRGIKRGHQFDKVEMVKFVAPETVAAPSSTRSSPTPPRSCERLEMPYRVRRDGDGRPVVRGVQEVRPRGVGAGLQRVARGVVVLDVRRLPGAARDDSRQERARTSRASCTRSTARGWRCRARSSPCSRTISAPTAASRCRRCCGRTSAGSRRSRRRRSEQLTAAPDDRVHVVLARRPEVDAGDADDQAGAAGDDAGDDLVDLIEQVRARRAEADEHAAEDAERDAGRGQADAEVARVARALVGAIEQRRRRRAPAPASRRPWAAAAERLWRLRLGAQRRRRDDATTTATAAMVTRARIIAPTDSSGR